MEQKQIKKLALAAGIFALAAALFLGTAYSKDESTVSYSGRVEVTEVDVNSKIPGKLAEVKVREGDNVTAGQVLAVLESDELKAKEKQALAVVQAAQEQVNQAKEAYDLAREQSSALIRQAQAGVSAADATLAKAKNGARKQEIAAAEASAAKAESAYLLAQKTYDRVNSLLQEGAVPQDSVDKAETALKAAYDDWNAAKQQLAIAREGARVEDIDAAQAQVKLYEAKLSEAQAGAKQAEIRLAALQAAQAQLRQAQGVLDEARAYLANTVIKAPVSGTITMLNADAGEMLSSGMPVLTVSKLNDAWVEVKVPETDVVHLKIGDQALVKVAGMEDKPIQGKIVRISALPDFATKRATNESGEKDIVSFGVKVAFPNDSLIVKPGMTAKVLFR